MTSSTGGGEFYNKVAKKFGGYKTSARYESEYPTENPEEVFKRKVLELGNKDSVVLDVGCADGRNTLSLAPNFQKIVAVDISDGMLKVARKNQTEQEVANVSFEKQDASAITYPNGHFDLIYSRRGPTFYGEFYRLLMTSGHYAEIQIGENDTRELKEIFGRGQDYGEWNITKLERNKKELEDVGFRITFDQDYSYNEYHASSDDFKTFLQGVPIFVDFDPEKDKEFLDRYITTHITERGILLPRHRVVIVAEK